MTKAARHYTAGGKAHRILARLAEGDTTLPDLVDVIGRVRPGHETDITRRVIGALNDEGFLNRTSVHTYRLLPAGLAFLAKLDERAQALPHARVFEVQP